MVDFPSNFAKGRLTRRSDPTVKQLILKLDEQASHGIVLEDLDQYRVLVVEPQVGFLRQQLEILLEENTYAAGTFLSIENVIVCSQKSEAVDVKEQKKRGYRE